MTVAARSAGRWVQMLQALTVRELVEGMGVSVRRVGGLLGVAPSAVSQYLSGKRLGRVDAEAVGRADLRAFARQTAELLLAAESPGSSASPQALLLARSADLASGGLGALHGPARPKGETPSDRARRVRSTVHRLRRRVVVEQAAVADCMRLAQKARDELTRAIFRQLASDSLRHAEIVASLTTYLDRGITDARVSGVHRREVERLIERERAAEEGTGASLVGQFGGVMALLVASMEADERKHEELLSGLLGRGFDASRLEEDAPRLPRAPATDLPESGRRVSPGAPGPLAKPI